MTLATVAIAITAVAADRFSHYEGLSGLALAEAVRADFSPKQLFETVPEGYAAPTWPCDAGVIGFVLPEMWTKGAVCDLYNFFGSDAVFEECRQTYIPTDVARVDREGSGWRTGTGYIAGQPINSWEPDNDRRGDLARRIMYMALMHPRRVWGDRAAMILADGEWPLLTTYGRELLGRWSAEDPVDERELAEMSAMAAVQGNENPFVVMPELFEYLWGEKADEGYVPDDKRERRPLRAVYSRSADGYIDFYSPYVPDGAVWALDGKPVEGVSVDLGRLTDGVHEITYTAGSARGKVRITVMP